MKRFFPFLAIALLSSNVFAQSPEKMSYQAVIRDASDQLVTNQGIGMQISILQTTSDGTPVYIETHSPTSNANGLVSLEIGNGTVVSGDFSAIDWANAIYYIKTETDPTTSGGTVYTITGTSQLLSVAYALHSKTAENVITDLVDDADSDPENEIQDISSVLTQGNDALNLELINLSRVGIGTSPGTPFHVKLNSTSISGGIRIETSQTTSENWYLYMPASDNLMIRNDALECVTFQKNTGYVGIGVIDPTANLDVNGITRTSAFQMTNGASDGYILQSNTIGNASWVENADNDPTNEIELPTGGINGQILITDGSGNYSWIDKNDPIEEWQTPILNSGFTPAGGNYSTVAFYKDRERVYLKGTMFIDSSVGVIFTLPIDYRPLEQHMYSVPTLGTGTGRIDIFPNGDVYMSNASTHIALDGISFRVN